MRVLVMVLFSLPTWLGPIINTVVSLGGLVLAGVITKRMVTPQDHDRANLLATIAESTAALVVNLNPKADWATLLKNTVDQIAQAAGLPTSNRPAIERAAALALAKLGKTNGA